MKQYITIFFIFHLLILSAPLFGTLQTDQKIYDVIIIGSGPAGLTAALFSAQMGLSPLVITGKDIGGQLNYAPKIINWPGEKSISGKELVGRLYQHAQVARVPFLHEEVVTIECTQQPFVVKTNTENIIGCNSMIIATGSKPKLLNIPGEKEYWGNGISTCALCDGMLYKQKKIAIIGSGNMALQNALHMTNIADHIFLITEKNQLSGTKHLQETINVHPRCTVLLQCKPTAFLGEKTSGITKLTYFDAKDQQEKALTIDGVFISIGSIPNIDLLAGKLEMNASGTFPKITEAIKTSIPGIFIAIPTKYQQAIICAGLGCMAALAANHYLKNQRKETKKEINHQ